MRECKRIAMKRKLGTSKIGTAWRAAQVKKYGFGEWLRMAKRCDHGQRRWFEK